MGRDISVVGYDNNQISKYLRPQLTTSDIPLRKIGKVTAEYFLKLLEDELADNEKQETIKLPCNIIIRESVRSI